VRQHVEGPTEQGDEHVVVAHRQVELVALGGGRVALRRAAGAGGGAELAARLEVPLVGQVPLVQALREGSDSGRPIVVTDPDGDAATAIRAIAEVIDVELAPKRRYNAGLKLLG